MTRLPENMNEMPFSVAADVCPANPVYDPGDGCADGLQNSTLRFLCRTRYSVGADQALCAEQQQRVDRARQDAGARPLHHLLPGRGHRAVRISIWFPLRDAPG